MKITIETPTYGQRVEITTSSDDLTISQVIEQLVRPALKAMGYQPDHIAEEIGEINDEGIATPVKP